MSTYNGEEFIEEQLDSIIKQTYKNWKLKIRDDGSTDNTINIINKYIEIDNRIELIENENENLGPGKSFLKLLNHSNSDYVVFTDQDDVWLENKLQVLIKFSKEIFHPEIPSLAFSDAYFLKGSTISKERVAMNMAECLSDFVFNNGGYQGCSFIFNKKLSSDIKRHMHLLTHAYMHDHIISLYAHTFGKVFYVNEKLFLYRQHAKNVTGKSKNSFFLKIFNFYKNEKSLIQYKHYKEKQNFFDVFQNLMSQENFSIFREYLNYPKLKKTTQIQIAITKKIKINGSRSKFLIKLLTKETLK